MLLSSSGPLNLELLVSWFFKVENILAAGQFRIPRIPHFVMSTSAHLSLVHSHTPPDTHRTSSNMTIRIATRAISRTFVRSALPAPSRALPRASFSTSTNLLNKSRPDVPSPTSTDQGATGPSQSSHTATGPSGTVPDHRLSDPYPLPFSPDIVDLNNADSGPESGPESKWADLNLASERQGLDGVDAPMRVPGREGEDRDQKVARLVYQCRKRGTLETDLLLSTFAKKELKTLPNEELDEFDRVSTLPLPSVYPRKSTR